MNIHKFIIFPFLMCKGNGTRKKTEVEIEIEAQDSAAMELQGDLNNGIIYIMHDDASAVNY